jgi:predicted aspartyl protease
MVANEGGKMGRVAAELKLSNAGDREVADRGLMPADQVRTAVVTGIVDTGAAMLVLPEGVANQLGLRDNGQATVRYADHRTATRRIVEQLHLELLGRHGVFTAIVEPGRTTALIGAIVLEALDLLVDCRTQTLHPRDPDRIIAEIE